MTEQRSGWRQLRRTIGSRLELSAAWVAPWVSKRRWVPTAIVIGVGPLVVSVVLGIPGQQWVSAVLLAIVTLGMVAEDRWKSGVVLMGLAFLSHCVTAVTLVSRAPEASSVVMPDAAAYWDKQRHWIETGEDPEYQLSAWVPAHAQLAIGATIYTASSLGALTFAQGFYEVDLMNFYLGQLIRNAEHPGVAALTGWHPWSQLRGVGFLFLTFEVISASFAWWTERAVSTWRLRGWRWGLGIGFLLSDGIVKLLFLELVRLQLHEVLG